MSFAEFFDDLKLEFLINSAANCSNLQFIMYVASKTYGSVSLQPICTTNHAFTLSILNTTLADKNIGKDDVMGFIVVEPPDQP